MDNFAVPSKKLKSEDYCKLEHTKSGNANKGAIPKDLRYGLRATRYYNENDKRKPNKLRLMSFTRMEHLLKEDPNTICVVLNNKDEGLLKLLVNDNHMIKNDWVILILKLLEQVTSSSIDMKRSIIIESCHYFIPILIQYLQNLPFQSQLERDSNTYYWNHSESVWHALIKLCNEIMMIMPQTAVEKLPKLLAVMQMFATTFGKKLETHLNEDIINEINQLNEILTNLISKHEYKSIGNKNDVREMPFGDYRDISVMPEYHELIMAKRPKIRPNIVNGKYLSVYHYLDVQFRLLREDFIAPLRNGITQYLSPDSNSVNKDDGIRIYKKVKITNTTIEKDQFCFIVSLNLQVKQLDSLKNSKRLMHGSLLIFTKDSFQTIIIGTLIKKTDDFLENKGKILVDIQLNTIDIENCFGTNFVMLESVIYFEPYRHVLKTLQQMTEQSFPMPNYILKTEVTGKPPSYLTEESYVKIKGDSYKILNANHWETLTPEKLKYDITQYEAFKSALTKEFCIIQGPPGTGKTFIGLEIIETLLVNKELWYNDENGQAKPILVVCYTNHALDQFLEGVIKVTKSVARIGGQSKKNQLNDFNIKELRMKAEKKQDLKRAASTLKLELNNIATKIDNLCKQLQMIQRKEPIVFDLRFEFENHNIYFKNKAEFERWIIKYKAYYDDIKLEQHRLLRILGVKINDDHRDLTDDSGEILGIVKALDDDEKKLKKLWKTNNQLDNLVKQNQDLENKKELTKTVQEIEKKILAYESSLCYLEFRFKQNVNRLPQLPHDIKNKYDLNHDERWALYWNCLENTTPKVINEIKVLQIKYNDILNDYNTVQQMEDLIILRNCLVVGMTTTGAAKFRTILEGLQSPIVIVEEAAEVLESHIVTSLTSNCNHLILIGDHKQLRPSTSVYRLAKYYNLDISLFERMINNGMHCLSLGVQHRMRPEFAQLIVPSIYSNLKNHDSVDSYPQIMGLNKNLFFVKHSHFEEILDVDSKQNSHEAKFLLQLCRHLILQGYAAKDITILTTYNGQMFYMKRLQKEIPAINDVRITVVDNFQGEESNIILLSLVRSNEEGKIGFLANENRICVALSRAKHGFYIIGNMEQFISHSNSKWPEINEVLEQNRSIGTSLGLQCRIHIDQEIYVNCADDFIKNCPEGGCLLTCNLIMPCGHVCERICHIQDRDHAKNRCIKPCIKNICEREHGTQCPNVCYMECGKCMEMVDHILPCSHEVTLKCYIDPFKYKCKKIINAELPCGHEKKILCSDDIETALCEYPCKIQLPCGHTCSNQCHIKNDPYHIRYKCQKACKKLNKNCSLDHKCDKLCYEECNLCNVIIEKKHKECEHYQKVECNENIDDVLCPGTCSKKLECGHPCVNLCGEICDRTKCQVQVEKVILVCGHSLKVECQKIPERKNCKQKCPLKLPCGHVCNNWCYECDGEDCSIKICQTMVENSFVVDCNHKFMIPCFKEKIADWNSNSQDLLKHCNNLCNYMLECKHKCTGNCGECYQGRIHKACSSKCSLTLLCGHPCESLCGENCRPCMKKCKFSCRHIKCKKLCGEPCTPCNKRCPWQCKHFKCTKKCGDICNREPCNEPCVKTLSCGHQCIGLCGEKCPNVCRVCNPKHNIFIIQFGDENKEKSRFIKLEDCGHIFEVNGLEKKLMISKEKINRKPIGILKCPKCDESIIQTLRYSKLIKQTFVDITNIKKKILDDHKINYEIANTLCYTRIPQIVAKDDRNLLFICGLLEQIVRINQILKKPNLNADILSFLDSMLGMIELILDGLIKIHQYETEISTVAIEHAIFVKKLALLNQQSTNDLILETHRFIRLRELAELLSTDEYKKNYLNSDFIIQKKKVIDSILASKKFTLEYDLIVKQNLLEFEKLLKLQGVICDEVKQSIERTVPFVGRFLQGEWFKCLNGHCYAVREFEGISFFNFCENLQTRLCQPCLNIEQKK